MVSPLNSMTPMPPKPLKLFTLFNYIFISLGDPPLPASHFVGT